MMIYVDDIIVATADLDIHVKNLEIVFSKLREANLKLHRTKCSLMLPKCKYLGFIFSPRNVGADPEKTVIIKNDPQPTCTKDDRSFFGITNYFRRHLKS